MFETSLGLGLTHWGEHTCKKIDPNYYKCWEDLKPHFKEPTEEIDILTS